MSVPPPFLDDTLSEEERRYASELPLAPQTVLAENLRILKIRELRLLRRMQALEEGPEAGRWEKSLHSVQDLIRRNVESMAKVARHEKERGAGGEAEGPRTGVLIVPGMMEEDTWARHAKE